MQQLNWAVEAIHVESRQHVSQEGLIGDMLQSVFRRAKDTFNSIFTNPDDKSNVMSFTASFQREDSYKHLTAAAYPLLARQKVDGMEGFNGKYVDYTPVVLHGIAYFDRQLDESLKFYRTLVGSIINNRSTRASWEDLTPRFEKSAEVRTKEDSENADFWRKGSYEAVTTVGAVTSRLQDFAELDIDAESLVKTLKAYDLKKIKARVDEISDYTQILAKEIEAGRLTDLSKAQVNNLAAGIMELALQTEHFSIAVYRGHMYLNAIKRLQDVVKAYH
jgi:hypothetical protein